jgi:hypothetical protein
MICKNEEKLKRKKLSAVHYKEKHPGVEGHRDEVSLYVLDYFMVRYFG